MTRIYFSDFFGVDPELLEEYGAFDISLVNDLPLFVDPFLLFNSEKPEYQALHAKIIGYMRFLKDMTLGGASFASSGRPVVLIQRGQAELARLQRQRQRRSRSRPGIRAIATSEL